MTYIAEKSLNNHVDKRLTEWISACVSLPLPQHLAQCAYGKRDASYAWAKPHRFHFKNVNPSVTAKYSKLPVVEINNKFPIWHLYSGRLARQLVEGQLYQTPSNLGRVAIHFDLNGYILKIYVCFLCLQNLIIPTMQGLRKFLIDLFFCWGLNLL